MTAMIVRFSPATIRSQIEDMDHADGVDAADLARDVIAVIEETAELHGASAVEGGSKFWEVEGDDPNLVRHLNGLISDAIDAAIENA
jgi:hypothetical protein